MLEPGAAGLVIEREARRLERLVGDLLDLARLRRRSFSVRAEPLDLARARGARRSATRGRGAVVPGRAPDAVGARRPRGRRPGSSPPGALEPRRERPALDPRRRHGADPRRPRPPRGRRRRARPRGGRPAAGLRALLPVRPRAGRPARRARASGSRSSASSREAMGGEALVRSTPGVGSTFSLVLPRGRRRRRPRGRGVAPAPLRPSAAAGVATDGCSAASSHSVVWVAGVRA